MAKKQKETSLSLLAKCPTGITGIDDITGGGLPKGRPTLVSGKAGSGKSLFAAEVLYRGATEYKEPGLYVSFEESENEVITNVASLGFDFKKLIAQKKLAITHIHIDRNEFEEIGSFNLDGLFIQLDYLVKKHKVKRIAIDTLEVLFSNIIDHAILRAELQRLFQWIKENNITAIITAESGTNLLSRHGLEEYVADCVILLDNRIEKQISTRRLRIIKYRGSDHGVNEYPFMISNRGILVLPITSLELIYPASTQRVSTGVNRLDTMLGGKGYYRGSSILISGVAGTGKSSLAAAFANSICLSGKRCLYFAFEESVEQIIRNMKSIGINLAPLVKKNLLLFHTSQPYSRGIESHLVKMYGLVEKFQPHAVIIDPITNLKEIGNEYEVKSLFARLINYLKMQKITILSTSLLTENIRKEQKKESVSSLMDTWILLEMFKIDGEQNRSIIILKSRGMNHSNQIREIILNHKGIHLEDVYIGSGQVLTGSARIAQAAKDKADQMMVQYELKSKHQKSINEYIDLETKIRSLQIELKNLKDDINLTLIKEKLIKSIYKRKDLDISMQRMIDESTNSTKDKRGE